MGVNYINELEKVDLQADTPSGKFSLQDLRQLYYKGKLGLSGTKDRAVNEMLRDYLISVTGAVGVRSIYDLWMLYLVQIKGQTRRASLGDMLKEFFGGGGNPPIAKYAVAFNSGTGNISVPNAVAFQGLSAFTAEMYLKIQSVSDATYARIFDYHNGSSGFNLYFNNLALTLSTDCSNGITTVSPNFATTLSLATVYHIALVWDGASVFFYVGGVQDSVHPGLSGGNTGNPAIKFYFGNEAAVDRGGKVTIDEFRLSNNARYTSNFTPPTGALSSDANTIELFHFDEGIGTTTTGTAGNVGTLAGSPLPAWATALV